MSEWISVSKELPLKAGYYLVVIDKGVASLKRGRVEIDELYHSVSKNLTPILKFQDYVTHWQIIPKLPTDE